jgi:hypothetical protein
MILKRRALDVKLVSLIWRDLLKNAVKMNSVVKFFAFAICVSMGSGQRII